jgi:predicted nucleic acid-binding protein
MLFVHYPSRSTWKRRCGSWKKRERNGTLGRTYRASTMIVDANLAVYWFVETPLTKSASALLERSDLVAPGVIEIEIVNALAKYVRAGLITAAQLRKAMVEVGIAFSELVADRQLLNAATELALAHKHPVYDCLYLALALERREPLATADRRLAALAQSLGIETALIEPTPE